MKVLVIFLTRVSEIQKKKKEKTVGYCGSPPWSPDNCSSSPGGLAIHC
jgi:hypothetical protein